MSAHSGTASLSLKGIFAYLNYQVPRTRKKIFETLVKGLQRLEYRGYDSAGKALGFTALLTCTYTHMLCTKAYSAPLEHLREFKI